MKKSLMIVGVCLILLMTLGIVSASWFTGNMIKIIDGQSKYFRVDRDYDFSFEGEEYKISVFSVEKDLVSFDLYGASDRSDNGERFILSLNEVGKSKIHPVEIEFMKTSSDKYARLKISKVEIERVEKVVVGKKVEIKGDVAVSEKYFSSKWISCRNGDLNWNRADNVGDYKNGKNYRTFGAISTKKKGKSEVEYVDKCKDGNLIEYFCVLKKGGDVNGGKYEYRPAYETVECEWGCYDGKCRDGEIGEERILKKEPNNFVGWISKCGVTDGGRNYEKQGILKRKYEKKSWLRKKREFKYGDSCYNDDVLIEIFCGEDEKYPNSFYQKTIDKYCRLGCKDGACKSVNCIGGDISKCNEISNEEVKEIAINDYYARYEPELCLDDSCMRKASLLEEYTK